MSLVLGIETSGDEVGCAIGSSDEMLAALSIPAPQMHCENLAPLIQQALKQAGVGLGELDLLAVDVGPGLYTGLRVGIASAMFLAYGKKLPVVGFSSLDMLAFQAIGVLEAQPESKEPDLIIPVLDARRNEVFYSGHLFPKKEAIGEKVVARTGQVMGEKVELIKKGVAAPEALPNIIYSHIDSHVDSDMDKINTPETPAELDVENILLVGNRTEICAPYFAPYFDRPSTSHISPTFHMLPALQMLPGAETLVRMAQGTNHPPEKLLPIYLRHPDAVVQTSDAVTQI